MSQMHTHEHALPPSGQGTVARIGDDVGRSLATPPSLDGVEIERSPRERRRSCTEVRERR